VRVWPGRPDPLGATWDGSGTNFALFSEPATRVDLCLYDEELGAEIDRVSLPERTRNVWHGYLPDVRPGQLYGYRLYGRYAPRDGLRVNPAKLVVDPYALAIAGEVDWKEPVFAYRIGGRNEDLTRDVRNSDRGIPKAVVVDQAFDWGDDRPPGTPLEASVIYEAHVKGLTMRHPDVPETLRGTYAGLATPPIVEYLTSLGVTAIELLPVHEHVDDKFLLDRGLANYWGYNTLGFFAPDGAYSSSGVHGEQVAEFKAMVRAMHAAGLEVILDVVYNHTAEGNHLGPTLSFKGIDNDVYYCLTPDNRRFYRDYTGCGNSIGVQHPQTVMLIVDSLRYWVEACHVDGFRFDLAVTLGRERDGYNRGAALFDVLHQDPVLARTKLIAEPWDVGDYGYQVGNFPIRWSEWNGKYRDNVRKFWKGDNGQVPEFAFRLSGSSDLYRLSGRGPSASINFVTAHDGFTLRDLVSYNDKHNEANGENNHDGANDNESWNSGAEGPSEDPTINKLRLQRQRNFLATLFLAQGTPMLLGGDESGRTQQGNNNAYCQDNEIAWLDWDLNDEQQHLLEFTRWLICFRREHPILRRRKFFDGLYLRGSEIKDLTWFKLQGTEISDQDWADQSALSLGMRLSGDSLDELDVHGERMADDTLLVLLNAYHEDLPFVLPPAGATDARWQLLLDTRDAAPRAEGSGETFAVGATFDLGGRSMALFKQTAAPPPPATAPDTRATRARRAP
jgi:glycogen operon protein